MEFWILLAYVLPALGVIGTIWLVWFAVDKFGFFGLLILMVIFGVLRVIFDFIELIKRKITKTDDYEYSRDEEDQEDEEESKKKYGYRNPGLFDLKSRGGIESCSTCKHFSGSYCYMQDDNVDPNHVCSWYKEE